MGRTGSRGSNVVIKSGILTRLAYFHQLNDYIGDVFYPTEQIQPRQEVICGHLCLFVFKEMQKGKGLQEIINTFW